MSKSLAVLLCVAVMVTAACAVRNRDYRFGITGLVTDEHGTPLQDADVTLQVYGEVYSGVSPVQTDRLKTNSTGGFVFMHISHQRGVKYTVTIHKDGFEPQTVSGTAPPDGHHTIVLKESPHQRQ